MDLLIKPDEMYLHKLTAYSLYYLAAHHCILMIKIGVKEDCFSASCINKTQGHSWWIITVTNYLNVNSECKKNIFLLPMLCGRPLWCMLMMSLPVPCSWPRRSLWWLCSTTELGPNRASPRSLTTSDTPRPGSTHRSTSSSPSSSSSSWR